MRKRQPLPAGRSARVCTAVMCLCLAAPSAASAYQLATNLNISGTSLTGIFDKSLGASGQWSVPVPATVGGQAAYASIADSTVLSDYDMWFIAPGGTSLSDGKMRWVGNPLISDASSGTSPNRLADGTFGGGGVLEIWGDLYDLFGTPLANDALLLTANVGGFQLRESIPTSNTLDLIGDTIVVPTGGLLYRDNAESLPGLSGPAMGFFGEYLLGISISGAYNTNSGVLDDFGSNIDLTSGLQFSMIFEQVPEPASCLLLLLGIGLLRRGRIAAG